MTALYKNYNEIQLLTRKSGTITMIADAIIIARGLEAAFIGEMVTFSGNREENLGLVLNIEHDLVRIALVSGSDKWMRTGDKVYGQGRPMETRVGWGLLGRVMNPLGICLNRTEIDPVQFVKSELFSVRMIPVERDAPGIIRREPVRRNMHTGINAIDCMLPIGCGQRELIIGDLGTGKSSMAISIILNQRKKNKSFWRRLEIYLHGHKHMSFVPCLYIMIGGRRSEIARIKRLFTNTKAFDYTTIVFTAADDLAALQYISPFAGCSIGEWFRDNGYNSVIIYDELLNHASSYRQVSLLLRRPPGREAFPGDIFYLHARLLERAAQMTRRGGGGALTAFPLVETKAGDISAYIPTNIISITDGQIFLSAKLANQGMRPAIDLNLSVSRIGADAQLPCMKTVARRIKLDYGLYRAYSGVEKLSGDIDPVILSYVVRGKRIMEYFRQEVYLTESYYEQIVSLYAIAQGYLDNVPQQAVKAYFQLLFNLECSQTYLDPKLYHYVCSAEYVEYMCESLDFHIVKYQLDEWLSIYTPLFITNYNERVYDKVFEF